MKRNSAKDGTGIDLEIEIDRRALIGIAIMGVSLGLIILLWIASHALNFIGQFAPKPGLSPDTETQLEYLEWSICEQKDALQMYRQNPGSNHPLVIKMKDDMALYDRMAAELGKEPFPGCS